MTYLKCSTQKWQIVIEHKRIDAKSKIDVLKKQRNECICLWDYLCNRLKNQGIIWKFQIISENLLEIIHLWRPWFRGKISWHFILKKNWRIFGLNILISSPNYAFVKKIAEVYQRSRPLITVINSTITYPN